MSAKSGRVLVTGGAGFIGGHLCNDLLDKGHNIIILDNLSTTNTKQIFQPLLQNGRHVELIQGDCNNSADVRTALEDVEIVFHLAADPQVRLDKTTPKTCYYQNLHSTQTLLEQIAESPQINTIIFASTSAV